MKKVIFAVLAVMAFAAQASNNSNPCGNNGNNCNTGSTTNAPVANGGAGGQGGAGGTGLAIAGAASAAEAKANAAAMAAQQQGQQQGQAQGQGQIATGGKATGGAANGVVNTKVDITGDNYEAAASSVFAAPIPTVATSCRLYMFGGGTTVSGAVSGSVPLGNDQTCLSGNNVNAMLRTNQIFPGTYGVKDIVTEQCKVEGMETADACKALKK